MTRVGMALVVPLLALPCDVAAQARGRDAIACVQRTRAHMEAHQAAVLRYTDALQADPGGAAHMGPRTCAALRQAVAAGSAYLRHLEGKDGCPALAVASAQRFAGSLGALARRYQQTCRSVR